jgi:hypothetical protein
MPMWLQQVGIALPPAGPFSLSFDWLIEPGGLAVGAQVMRATGMGTPYGEVDLVLTGNQAQFAIHQGPVGAPVDTAGDVVIVPSAQWLHVVARFEAQMVKVSIADQVITTAAFPYTDTQYRQMSLEIGLGAGAGYMHFDNVMVGAD